MKQVSIGRHGGRVVRLAPALLALHAATSAPTYMVVNMMPALWANETTQNSEPSVSVNASAGQLVVASAFASGMHFCAGGTSAPLFLSTDEGTTWNLACMIPTDAARWPGDMTVRISADAKSLYAGALDSYWNTGHTEYRMDSRVYAWSSAPSKLDAALVSNPGDFSALTSSTLFSRDRTDQPQVRGVGGDRAMAWVGENRSGYPVVGTTTDTCKWVVAAVAGDPWVTPPTSECLSEERPPDSTVPAARVATAGKTTYVLMYRPVLSGNANDVVVYRRDHADFHALTDGSALSANPANGSEDACHIHDGRPGFRAVTCAMYSVPASPSDFGQEREAMTELSIAADPGNPQRVYIAWAEQSPTDPKQLALHFSHSDDGGQSWKPSPWVVDNATNPTLAVASDGAVGVLYEQLSNHGTNSRWNTQLAISTNRLKTKPTSHLLASVLASAPSSVVPPYLGDYLQLEAKGKNFYGVFPASNDLSTGEFPDLCDPAQCTGQRPYKNNKPVDAANNPVAVSIDPYFVRVVRP
jgi:hypothetical protein